MALKTDSNPQSRREFLRSCGRYLALGGLGALAATGFIRRNAAPSHGHSETCGNNWMCRPCRKNSTCRLPQAESFRQHRNTENVDR